METSQEISRFELSKKRKKRPLGIIVSVILWTFIIVLTVGELNNWFFEECDGMVSPCLAVRIPMIIFTCISYIIYIISSLCTGTMRYFKNIMNEEELAFYVNGLKRSPPNLRVGVTCYHYETRTRTVSSTDSNGNRQTRTETYTEKVVTFTESEQFVFSKWMDFTGEIPALRQYGNIIKIKFLKTFLFTPDMRQKYEAQSKSIYERNRHRDSHISYWENFDINGYKTGAMVIFKRPIFFRMRFYLICTFLGLSVPYRFWTDSITTSSEFTFKKQFGASEAPPTLPKEGEPVITCVFCNGANHPYDLFCGRCGSNMRRACSNCGYQNVGLGQSCNQCQQPFNTPPPYSSAPPEYYDIAPPYYGNNPIPPSYHVHDIPENYFGPQPSAPPGDVGIDMPDGVIPTELESSPSSNPPPY